MKLNVTVVCENSIGRAIPAIGEHGFACWLELDGHHYLMDSGQGLGIINNAQVLKLPLEKLEAIIISHGHYDHAGGLDKVLRFTGAIDVYAHPEIFAARYAKSADAVRFVGIPVRREVLETLGANFIATPQFRRIAPNLWVTGAVERSNDFEHGDANLVRRRDDGTFEADPFNDDMAVIVDTPKGLCVILGCAHAGIINTLDHICARLQRDDIYAVIGGTHLGPVSARQFDATMKELERFNIEKIGVSHCTGQMRAALVREKFPQSFFFASVGAKLEIS